MVYIFHDCFVYLKSKEHEVNPYPWVPGLHGKEVFVVEAMFSLTLAGKVQLGMLLILAFCTERRRDGNVNPWLYFFIKCIQRLSFYQHYVNQTSIHLVK